MIFSSKNLVTGDRLYSGNDALIQLVSIKKSLVVTIYYVVIMFHKVRNEISTTLYIYIFRSYIFSNFL